MDIKTIDLLLYIRSKNISYEISVYSTKFDAW